MLPNLADLDAALLAAIKPCKDQMTHTTVAFEDELKKGKDTSADSGHGSEASSDEDADNNDDSTEG